MIFRRGTFGSSAAAFETAVRAQDAKTSGEAFGRLHESFYQAGARRDVVLVRGGGVREGVTVNCPGAPGR